MFGNKFCKFGEGKNSKNGLYESFAFKDKTQKLIKEIISKYKSR